MKEKDVDNIIFTIGVIGFTTLFIFLLKFGYAIICSIV